MKKPILTFSLLILLTAVIVPVHASIEIQAVIEKNIHVVFDLENMDPAIYNETVQQGLFNVATIPTAINNYFEQRNLTKATCDYDPAQVIFRTRAIQVECHLAGSDVLGVTINAETMTKNYRVRTDWRNFRVGLTNETFLDFTEYFATSVSQWEQVNYTLNGKKHQAYYHNATNSNEIDPIFYFILPEKATNVHAVDETIIFEIPIPVEEALIDSPFLILATIIVLIIIAQLYRIIRK